LESTKRTLRCALEFINDDRHLTDQGIAARKALLEEIEAIEQDLEAVRQEHGLVRTCTICRAGVLRGSRPLCLAFASSGHILEEQLSQTS
jgi:hypothetical protein